MIRPDCTKSAQPMIKCDSSHDIDREDVLGACSNIFFFSGQACSSLKGQNTKDHCNKYLLCING